MSKEIFDTFKFKSGAELKNRVLMAPMTIQAGYFDGSVTSEMIDYYQFLSLKFILYFIFSFETFHVFHIDNPIHTHTE